MPKREKPNKKSLRQNQEKQNQDPGNAYVKPKELNFKLDNEQISARQDILNNDITVLIGKAGCGKTALACYTALKMLIDNDVERIIITRPMVANEDMGSLPGTLEEKYTPWMRPIIENFYKMSQRGMIDCLMKNKNIEMLPLQFTRGCTYTNSFVLVDESQNCTLNQLKMILTRIGEGSKIILTGDLDQVDLKKVSDSGLTKICKFDIDNFKVIEMENEHRKKIVLDIIEEFKKIETQK